MEPSEPKSLAVRTPDKPKRTPPNRAGKGPTPASFRPGMSGNVAGRPKGFAGVARLIAESTRDCAELVEWALDVWRDVKRPHAERAAAHQWLSDRALGRPMASTELTVHAGTGVGGEYAVAGLSDERLQAIAAELRGELPAGGDGGAA